MFFIGFTCLVEKNGYEIRAVDDGDGWEGTAFDTGPEDCLVPLGGGKQRRELDFEKDEVFLELANANTRQRAVAFANRFGMLDGMPDPPIEDFFFRIQRSFAAALQGPESTATITAVAEILKSRMGRRSLPSLGPLRTELRITKEKKAEIRFFASSLLQFALIQLVNSHAGLDNIRQCAAPSCGRFFNAKGVTKKRTYCRDAHKSARYRHANPDRVEASKQKKRLARSLARSSRGIAKNKIRNEIEPSRKRTAKQSTRRG